MSGICGYVGAGSPALFDNMLRAIEYRGDRSDVLELGEVGLGYRWWQGRPGKATGIECDKSSAVACAGTFAPAVTSPAIEVRRRIESGFRDADGAFAGAHYDIESRTLTLVRDPFGVRSLYYVLHDGSFYFASELKQLLVIESLPIELDPVVVHKYLTFSFVPGERVPIKGIRRLLPGHLARVRDGVVDLEAYFAPSENLDPTLSDQHEAVRRTRIGWRKAVERRLNGEQRVGVFLSGGIDSSGIAYWLARNPVDVQCFSLDFGNESVEREQASSVTEHLGLPLQFVPVDGAAIDSVFLDLVWKLDLPFGDPVTGPQYLLGRAARETGLTTVFNGEGGDQLFGGWTNKPMISAEIYAGLYDEESREETYLRSYHRFYGEEDALYTQDFKASVGGPGQRREHLMPYLSNDGTGTFLGRMRLADTALKGSQNILPRAERMANAWGLDVRVPLFDRELAEHAFALPSAMKLHGASEKHVLKLVLQNRLPDDIVWRRKFGMSVPMTQWQLGPLAPRMLDLLGPKALAARGLFREDYVTQLREGRLHPADPKRRRIGERLWTLAMLEAWIRVFVDGRARAPR